MVVKYVTLFMMIILYGKSKIFDEFPKVVEQNVVTR